LPRSRTARPAPAALEATVSEITAAGPPRRIVSEAGTFTLEDKMNAAETLKAAGHIALDCPVSGTGAQARTKDLVIYASGDTKTSAGLLPMVAALSRAGYDLGPIGNHRPS